MDAIKVLQAARGLASEDGENEEYDRALVELTSDILGVHFEARTIVAFAVVSEKSPLLNYVW